MEKLLAKLKTPYVQGMSEKIDLTIKNWISKVRPLNNDVDSKNIVHN